MQAVGGCQCEAGIILEKFLITQEGYTPRDILATKYGFSWLAVKFRRDQKSSLSFLLPHA